MQTRSFKTKIILILIALLAVISFGVTWSVTNHQQTTSHSNSPQKQSANKPTIKRTTQTDVAKKIDWQAPSEKKAYPDPKHYSNYWIKVSIAKQRVYLMNDNQVLYTMYASTGSKESPTPTGTFYTEAEHGESFYNANSGEGAKYWLSWLDHGTYLFHSVPTDQDGHFIISEAKRLGQEANSHGCIRLSVPDAKWLYVNTPYQTKVVIQ